MQLEKELLKGINKSRKDLTDVSKDLSEISYHAGKNDLDKISKFSTELQKEIDSIRDKIIKFERSF